MTIYDFLNSPAGNKYNGCVGCPFAYEGSPCDEDAGNTAMDERGECPVDGIATAEDMAKAEFP